MESINCIIIHGCPSNIEKAMSVEKRTYDKHWIPWTKKELIKQGIKTETPLMPDPWAPDYEAFKKEFEKCIINENTVLVGHSCGTAFLVRWLGESKQPVKKLILVAPWKIPDEGDKFREAFYTYPIDESITSRVQEIIMFTADNERADGKKGLEMYHEALGGRVINLLGRGHYILRDMGTEEFPELLQAVIRNKSISEMVIEVDDQNKLIGLRPREDFYGGRIIHRSSQLVLFNSKRELLIAKRSLAKRWYPGLYTYSVSGTVNNETNDECMKREIMEEIGIEIPFKNLFTFRNTDDSNDEFVTVYAGTSDQKIYTDKQEIAEVSWVTLEWLKKDMEFNSKKYTHSFLEGMKVYWKKYGTQLP